MTDKSKKDRNDGTGWKVVTRQMFLSVAEIQGLLGMSKSYCYELEKMDKIVIPGKVPTQFFLEKFYGMELTDEMLEEARKHETKKQTV